MIEPSPHAEGSVLPVKAQPGARRNALLGERNGAVRVAVSAAPEKGKANAAIAEVLADALGLRPSQVEILAGETSREKRFLIRGLTPEVLKRTLAERLPPSADAARSTR